MQSHGARRRSAAAAVFTLLALLITFAAPPANGYWTSAGTGTASWRDGHPRGSGQRDGLGHRLH